MTDSIRLPAPAPAELEAAKVAMRAQSQAGNYTCGCFVALCRDPFFPPLVGHWRRYHPASLAILAHSQAQRSQLDQG